jgi:hypothetical protein
MVQDTARPGRHQMIEAKFQNQEIEKSF